MGVMTVESVGDSSSKGSVITKPSRVEMLVDGDRVTGDTGTTSVSEVVDSIGGG